MHILREWLNITGQTAEKPLAIWSQISPGFFCYGFRAEGLILAVPKLLGSGCCSPVTQPTQLHSVHLFAFPSQKQPCSFDVLQVQLCNTLPSTARSPPPQCLGKLWTTMTRRTPLRWSMKLPPRNSRLTLQLEREPRENRKAMNTYVV